MHVAYIIGTYPLLTTTFIDREIALLRRRGLQLSVLSLRRPARKLSPEQEQLQKDVSYLLPVAPALLLLAHAHFLLRRPLITLKTLVFLLSRPHPDARSRLKTLLHFGEGVVAAYLLRGPKADQLHAHFVDRAATVALVASRLLGIPYSATAHANDIFVRPVLLPEKIAGARFVATCTGYNETYLRGIAGEGQEAKIRRIYHGLDFGRYMAPRKAPENGLPRLLAVGQLKEKKGFTYLVGACRLLKEQGYAFDCIIVGEGPLRNALQAQIQEQGLESTMTLCGALSHDEVIEQYRQATVFTLPCVLSADGDRDGIPNVILEAMAMQLPVVSTEHSGIPEVITDGYNGLLVPPGAEEALAGALASLLDCSERRQQLGRQAHKTVKEKFSVEANVDQLLREFVSVT